MRNAFFSNSVVFSFSVTLIACGTDPTVNMTGPSIDPPASAGSGSTHSSGTGGSTSVGDVSSQTNNDGHSPCISVRSNDGMPDPCQDVPGSAGASAGGAPDQPQETAGQPSTDNGGSPDQTSNGGQAGAPDVPTPQGGASSHNGHAGHGGKSSAGSAGTPAVAGTGGMGGAPSTAGAGGSTSGTGGASTCTCAHPVDEELKTLIFGAPDDATVVMHFMDTINEDSQCNWTGAGTHRSDPLDDVDRNHFWCWNTGDEYNRNIDIIFDITVNGESLATDMCEGIASPYRFYQFEYPQFDWMVDTLSPHISSIPVDEVLYLDCPTDDSGDRFRLPARPQQ